MPVPTVPRYQDQPELAASISANPTFAALEQEIIHERTVSAMKWPYTYLLTDYIDGQASKPFTITIEQGTDFMCQCMTVSCFSYCATVDTLFPIPNAAGTAKWAGRGITMKITDTRSGRDLTSGDMPIELIATPGYGISFIKPMNFRHIFLRNSKIRFDMRNLDAATRYYDTATSTDYGTHHFNIAMHGYKYLTPGA